MIVYLDLDRTTFRTRDFGVVWEYLKEHYPVVADTNDDPKAYYHYVDDMYYYDMAAHLTALGLDPDAVFAELGGSDFADGRLEYEGTAELVATLQRLGYEVRVLTFGEDATQRFKASLCPSLRGLAVVTTRRPKPEVLDDLQEECWLVDDKPLGHELPGNVSFIQVNQEEAPVPPDTEWEVRSSLPLVATFFEAIAEE